MKILHLEDDPHDAELIRDLLVTEWPACEITCVASKAEFAASLTRKRFDVILSDCSLPGFDGLEALRLARTRVPDTPFIFVSGTIGEDNAIEAVKGGAADYVLKDRMKRLITAVLRAVREAEERRQRVRAEERIRELADSLNQATEAVVVTDLEGRITFWNRGAERLSGWSAGEALDRLARELFDGETGTALATACEAAAANGEWAGELELHDRHETPKFVQFRITIIREDDGRPRARLVLATDITERKRLEEQFLRSQRMENLGLLAAGIAHDLNNMLAPILLAAPMLHGYVNDPTAVRLIETLEKSADRGSQLVRQILGFAQGAGGDRQLIQVKHVLRDITAVIRGSFPKSIELDDRIGSDIWPISGNATQIHQVLLNLCVNARDAMPDGGVLRVGAKNQVVTESEADAIPGARPGAFLVLSVEDTGTGISPELLDRIWEPFFTTKEAGRGTGLGLSTVRGIIRSHRGFVEVRSILGKGSTFLAYLPAAEVTLREKAESAPEMPRGSGELILVVDDEQQIREMTSAILGHYGYRVLLACDGREAARLFAENARDISLVITDLHMPNLDGAMLGRALRQINPAAKMLVISGMASGLGTRSAVETDEFADALLLKPFKPESLLETVRQLLTQPAREPLSAGNH